MMFGLSEIQEAAAIRMVSELTVLLKTVHVRLHFQETPFWRSAKRFRGSLKLLTRFQTSRQRQYKFAPRKLRVAHSSCGAATKRAIICRPHEAALVRLYSAEVVEQYTVRKLLKSRVQEFRSDSLTPSAALGPTVKDRFFK